MAAGDPKSGDSAAAGGMPPPSPPFGESAVHVSQVIAKAGSGDRPNVFQDALLAVSEGARGEVDARRLGHWLARYERRIELGMFFERAGERQGSALWKVARVRS